ncbi:MAG: sigma 54-interacting transcriptional regulator [Proteobacteria bacterium]|nr:sigma 54-interacting transcriptional regulator [Pseudomonadota bacterium]
MNVSDNQFVREATHCLYSSLNIESTLFKAANYLKQFFPLDLAHMFIYDMSLDTFRYLALATEKRGVLIDEVIQISSRAKKEIRGHSLDSVNIFTKSKSHMIQEIFNHFRLNTRNPLIDEHEEFSALGIFLDIGMSLGGGFAMVARGKDRYNEDHKKRLKLLNGVLTGSVLNLMHHRSIVCQNELLAREKDELQKRLGHVKAHQIIGADSGLKEVMELVRYVGPTGSPVLITGETGVGKELIAHAVHQTSVRNTGPFICINCGAIPESLIDSELFGYEKGAFTGAVGLKRGYFEQANGGTIFLDEIGELPLSSQVKFLRVLQAMEFQRVGGNRKVSVDVRVIAATNRNLLSMVQKHQFREDLWFRLNVFPIRIPPLRDRKVDIPDMADYFLKHKAREMNLASRPLSKDAQTQLILYDWPGNIRELQNIIERALIVGKGKTLTFPNLSGNTISPVFQEAGQDTQRFLTMDEMTISHITKAMTLSDGQIDGKNGAAHRLGMNPSTLRGRMRKYGIKTTKTIQVANHTLETKIM